MTVYGRSARFGIATMVYGSGVSRITTAGASGYRFNITKEGMYLNWAMISETVQKYWTQQVCVLVVAIVMW